MNLTMPFKDPEKRKEYKKQWYQKNKEKNKEKKNEQKKEYYEKNKSKISEYQKEYQKKNREKIKDYKKEYRQTEKGKKSRRISHWRRFGVIHPNFDELYEKYINTEFCEFCSVKLTEDKKTTLTTRCLDHDHESGEFRNILCHSCNIRRG